MYFKTFKYAAAALLTSAIMAANASAPITLVVPFAPGGSQDAIGRYIADKLGNELNTTVIVKNVGGAGGVIGTSEVARAKGDGRTLLLTTGGSITIAPYTQTKLPYDVNRDLTPVALVADTPMAIAVKSDSQLQSLQDLIDTARAHPKKLSYASTGAGTVSNLTAELLGQSMKMELLHVPYRGASPGLIDLMGGEVQLIFSSMASLVPAQKSGDIRILAAFSDIHADNRTKIHTVAEVTQNKALDVPVWIGVMAPKSTAPDLITKMGRAVQQLCATQDARRFFAEQGATAICGGAENLQKLINSDSHRWKSVIAKIDNTKKE
ncbi:MAG TPA: tripartite tricarboxylate transporter substrate binding protein [Advenella sp.]|nr:tripartite tricarboxylate transporter substrate binding protein [Advenella sp.]